MSLAVMTSTTLLCARRADGLRVKGWLLHAHAESVLQLVERGQPAFVESHIPQAAERPPGFRVISAQHSRRLLHRPCLVLPAHCHLPFALFQGRTSPWRSVCPPGRATDTTHLYPRTPRCYDCRTGG